MKAYETIIALTACFLFLMFWFNLLFETLIGDGKIGLMLMISLILAVIVYKQGYER